MTLRDELRYYLPYVFPMAGACAGTAAVVYIGVMMFIPNSGFQDPLVAFLLIFMSMFAAAVGYTAGAFLAIFLCYPCMTCACGEDVTVVDAFP